MNEENDITKADRIVGITYDISVNITTRAFEERIYRRGAYIEWMTALPDFHGLDAPRASDTIELLAAYIVRKGAEPKGDGVPKWFFVGAQKISGCSGVGLVAVRNGCGGYDMTGQEQSCTIAYINRCLSAPVRKLLAAFEVAFSHSGTLCGESVHIPLGDNIDDPDQNIWLMPKETK